MQRYRLEMKPHPLCWLSPSAAVNEAPPGQYSGRPLQIRKSQGGLFTEAVGYIKNKTKKLYESEWPTFLRLLASQRRLAHLRGEEGGGNLAAASYPPTVTSQNVSFLRGSAGEEAVRAEQLPAKCADAVLVAHPPPETLEDHRRRVAQRAEERWVG